MSNTYAGDRPHRMTKGEYRILSRRALRAWEAEHGEDDALWAAPISAPYRADGYLVPAAIEGAR